MLLKNWYKLVSDTKWLHLILLILSSGIEAARFLGNGETVLVHCSDGWDRTSQIVSLAQILSDPYYRTINGLQLLIEKEWLSFGHQFHLRQGLEGKEKEEAPIFLQFLECVWNLTRKYPEAFEFNEEYLITIFDHSYSGVFGTFLLNNEKDRICKKLWKHTPSLWEYLDQNRSIYKNNWYNPNYHLVISPIHMRHIKIWERLFLRFDTSPQLIPKSDSSISESKMDLSSTELSNNNPENIRVFSDDIFNQFTSDPRRSTMEDYEDWTVGRRSLNDGNDKEVYEIPLNEERNQNGAFQIKSFIKLKGQNVDKK